MKYVRYQWNDRTFWGVLEGETIIVLDAAPYRGGKSTGSRLSLENVRLLAPSEPSKIVCVGKNYLEHTAEMHEEVPKVPCLFIKPSTCVNAPFGDVEYPRGSKRMDYEGELAVVIGKLAKSVCAENAADYILGYTILNDVTARDIQKSEGQWTRGKGFDGFAPFGPIVTDEINPERVRIRSYLNGEKRQDGSAGDAIFKIPYLIEFITQSMTLLPGDVVSTGTPAGIGSMMPGDLIEVDIDGIGRIANRIIPTKNF